MLDWWEPSEELNNDERIYLLCPAAEDCESDYAPELSFFSMFSDNGKGTCVFLTNNRCGIHAIKPKECRDTVCCTKTYADRHSIVRDWNTASGFALVQSWRERFMNATCGDHHARP